MRVCQTATCLTERPAEPRGAGAGDPVDEVPAGGPVLAGPRGTLVHVWRGGTESGLVPVLQRDPELLPLLTDLAAPAGEARQAGAGEGRVPGDAVVDAAPSVQARTQVLTHRGCGRTGRPGSLPLSLSLSLSLSVSLSPLTLFRFHFGLCPMRSFAAFFGDPIFKIFNVLNR